MKFSILTLFSEAIESYVNTSIIKRAFKQSNFQLNIINIRNFSNNKHKNVDDTIYGGKPGMLLQCQPLDSAIQSIYTKKSKLIFLCPGGKFLNQKIVKKLAKEQEIILVCGFYEGFDYRIFQLYRSHIKISIGPFIVSNGILPALTILDSIIRIQKNVLNNPKSAKEESFENGLLEEKQYTRPENYNGIKVPAVLKNGNPKKIKKWEKKSQLIQTIKYQPKLLEKKPISLNALNFLISYYTQ